MVKYRSRLTSALWNSPKRNTLDERRNWRLNDSYLFFSTFFTGSQAQWSSHARPRKTQFVSGESGCIPTARSRHYASCYAQFAAYPQALPEPADANGFGPYFVERLNAKRTPIITHGDTEEQRCLTPPPPLYTTGFLQRPVLPKPRMIGAIPYKYRGRLAVRCIIHEQRRAFRDYFTARLPGSSLHPDAAPPKAGKGNVSERDTTTVRIPLHTAKQHFGASRVRGTRPRNEDNYQAGVIDLPIFSPLGDPADASLPGEPSVFYFGVFDGHGGEDASLYLKNNLHRYIEETSKMLNPEGLSIVVSPKSSEAESDAERAEEKRQRVANGQATISQAGELSPPEQSLDSRLHCKRIQTDLANNWKETVGGYFRRFKPDFDTTKNAGISGSCNIGAVLVYAFLKADLDFITNTRPWFHAGETETPTETSQQFSGGSTASIVLISTSTPKPFWNPTQTSTLITAHLGDTRALLCRVEDGKAVPLTINHSPSSPTETARLRRYAAAFVQDSFGEERFGVLAITRALGDVQQKRLGVSAEPDLTVKTLGPGEYAFVVLVSDGITAVLGDQEIVDVVKGCKTPSEAAAELTKFCDEVGEVGDNATALVVRLGGWEKRGAGGEGVEETKALLDWKRKEAEEKGGRRRM